jgi:hypothetical protein
MQDVVLRGSLASFTLPELLSFLNTTRKTGTLTLASEGREAALFFHNGALVYASSNLEPFRLGQILLRKHLISRPDFARVDALMTSEGGRFGEIAIQQKLLTADQLRDFLKVQVSEIVFDCFVWGGGDFAFAHAVDLPPYAVTIAIDIGNLIMEGARRIEEWEQCLKLLPDKTAVPRVVSQPRDEKITLTADEWKILFLINGNRTLEELVQDSEEDALHVYRVIFGLLANQLVEIDGRSKESDEDTGKGDATVRQTAPVFGFESTVREKPDDTSLLVSVEAKLSYSDVVKAILARLTIVAGDGQGTTIPLLEPEYMIGRHRDNSIQLTDLGVSGFHARLFRGGDGYVVEDLKSRNGTWLNGMRVFHATLKHGDRLRLGQTDMLFEVMA